MTRIWRHQDVTARLELAAKTLRALPDQQRRYLTTKSNWPDYVQKYYEGSMDLEATAYVRVVPSAAEISKMDEALEWLRWISKCRHRDTGTLGRIIWARAEGFSWRDIAAMCHRSSGGVSHVTCVGWYKIGIVYITHRLNRTNARKRN